MTRAIGIDLGTTYTLVATVQDQRPMVVPNAEGSYLTPSVVCFPPQGEPQVGEAARRLAATHPHRAVFSIKRRMGSGYRMPVNGKGYTPQEISGLILRKAKGDAEEYLGESIGQAVITVPAYFNDRQRQATREAAALAGLEVMRIINEPTAAALAYGLHREEAHTVLVWDLGGGTFDVSILELGAGIFEVRAVSGDTWLGGDDFDHRVMDHLEEEYRKATGMEFPGDLGSRQRLKDLAEKAKIELSFSPVARVRLPLPGVRQPQALLVEVTRSRLESLAQDLLHRMITPTQEALAGAGLAVDEIDRIILVGGATRMPAVRALARQLFRKEGYRYIHADRVVATGAAIQAGMLLGQLEKAVLLDVLPLSLGVEAQGGVMAEVIPRNTPLPASGTRLFTTAGDCQTSMSVHVLQGERALAVDDISLGRLELQGIPAAPRGTIKVEVSFQVDVEGIVRVSAADLSTEEAAEAKVISSKFLDPQEAEEMVQEAACHEEMDREALRHVTERIAAQNLLAAAESLLPAMDGRETHSPPQHLLEALAQLQEAMADGVEGHLKACSEEVRRWLEAFHKEMASARKGSSH